MKLQHISLVALVAVMLGALSSCSKRGEIIDTIPADVTMVATLNFEKLSEAAGIKLKSDGIEVVPQMQGFISGDLKDVFEDIATARAEGLVDIDNIVIAVDADNVSYVTFAVNDLDRICEMTSETLKWSDNGGYKTARLSDMTVLATGSQAWCVNGSKEPAKAVDALRKRAGELSVGGLDGVAQALGRDNIINVAVASGFASLTASKKSNTEIPAQDKEWNIASINTGADNSLVAEWEMMQSTGRSIAVKGMKNINPALLAYVPENFSVTFAAGLTPEFDWEPLQQLLMLTGGFQTAAFLSVVNPYLASIDGTVLVAAAPTSAEALVDGDPSDWDFIALVHMPQDKINSLISMIRNMMSTAGLTPQMTADGIMMVPQYGKTLYVGNVDGYFGISTIGFDNTRNNSLAPTFVSKDMALNFSMNPYSSLVEGVGLELDASMAGGKGQAKLTVPGTQTPILVFLMTAAK